MAQATIPINPAYAGDPIPLAPKPAVNTNNGALVPPSYGPGNYPTGNTANVPKLSTTPTGPTGVATSGLATNTTDAQKQGTDLIQGQVDNHTANKSTANPSTAKYVNDFLTSKGLNTDFSSRSNYAKQAGITDYVGTDQQNGQLIGWLNTQGNSSQNGTGTSATTTPTPTTGTTTPTPTTGTTTPQPTAPTLPSTGSPGDAYSQDILGVQTEIGNALEQRNNQVQQIMNGTFPLTASQQASISATQAQFNEIARLQMIANKSYQGGVALSGNREGLNLQNPSEYLAEQNKAVTDGLQKINDLDATAAKTLADLQQSFMDKDYSMINDNYNALQATLKDKADALTALQTRTDNLFTSTRDYNQRASEFAQGEQDKVRDFNAQYGGLLDPTTGNVIPKVLAQLQASQGGGTLAGNALDTNSPWFKSLPAGVQRQLLMAAPNVPVIDSSTDQGKNFLSTSNAIQGLSSSLADGDIDANTPIWKALGLPRMAILGIGVGYQRGDDPSKALGLTQQLGLKPNASVSEVISTLQQQLAQSSGKSVYAFTTPQEDYQSYQNFYPSASPDIKSKIQAFQTKNPNATYGDILSRFDPSLPNSSSPANKPTLLGGFGNNVNY